MSHPGDPVPVLLVDDRPENLLALEGLLRSPELELLQARSGPEALELLLRHDVALALVDVMMPGMDGFELAELMRGAERSRRVPIIFLTAGSADRQRRFRGYEAGAVDFLHKPLEVDILRGKLAVFVELYRQRRDLRALADEKARLLKETRQYAAALEDANRRKDEFLAMLAHELRNPLAPVRNAVEILKLGKTGDPVIEQAREIIGRQVAHMARLVDDLLDVARIARGKVQLRTERADLAAVVRQTAEDYRPTLAGLGVELVVEVPAGPLWLVGDPTRLAQVVGNLLHNAGKFTPRGGRVAVRAEARGGSAVVSVSDSGAGIAPEVLARLFEPFAQADQALDRAGGGLGLGLALVRGLAQLHGGTASAQSAGPGRGATFTVALPLAGAESGPAAPGAAPGHAGPLRVLIVEDNRDAAESLQLLLGLYGHEVVVAFDARAGLALARRFRPDVVVSDLGLPGGMSGYDLAAAIRADAELGGVSLVALSGYGRDEDRRKAHSAGFDRHLVKPVDPAELSAALAAGHQRRVTA